MNVLSFVQSDLVTTGVLCFFASLSVAIVMRFFIKPAFHKLDDFIAKKFTDETLVASVYATVKNVIYMVLAGVLTLFALVKLYQANAFPYNNSVALGFLYYIPMYALQFYLDTHMRKLCCKWFGFDYEEAVEGEEVKEKKPKTYKIDGIKYIKDEAGQLVVYEEK